MSHKELKIKNVKIHFRTYDITDEDLKKMKLYSYLSIDTEATGLDLLKTRLCLMQIFGGDNSVFLIHFPDMIYNKSPNLKELLNYNQQKLFHFARFDLWAIYRYLGIMCKNIICTRIFSKIARTYSERHGLKNLLLELFKININKSEQSSYWGSESLTLTQKDYAKNDVLYLKEICDFLTQILIRERKYDFALQVCKSVETAVLCDDKNFSFTGLIDYQ